MNNTSGNDTDRALRGLRQIGSAQLVTQLVTWGLTAVTMHLLQPRDYGLIATAGLFTMFTWMLLDGGLAPVLVSQRELSLQLQGAAVTAVLMVSLLLAVTIFAVAPIGSSFFRSPPLRAILDVSAFYLPLTALGVVPRAQLSKCMQFNRLARVRVTAGISQGLSTLALAFMGEAYWALIIGAFVGTTLEVSLLWWSLDSRPTPNFLLRELTPLIRNGSHMIAQRLTYFVVGNFDTFLLSRIWGPAVLGPYSVARTLAHTVHEKISGVTGQISVPAFAARSEAEDQIRGLIGVVSITATIVFPLFWLLGIMSQVAIPWIFGVKWTPMVVPFLAFTAILPLRTIYTFLNSSLIGTGRTGLTLKNTLSWAVILVPLVLIGSIKGAVGVAIGWAAAVPVAFYVAMRRTSKVFGIDKMRLLRPLIVPAVCGAASALSAEAIFLGLASRLAPVFTIACECVVGAVCFPVSLKWLSQSQYEQTVSFVRRVVRV